MDKFLLFMKQHWLVTVVGIVALIFAIVGVPLLINLAFSVPAFCDFLVVDWEAKDALAYYGSALGFVGTVIFSGLALWQNHIIKTESDLRAELVEKMELQKNMPIISINAVRNSGKMKDLDFTISNLSDNIAKNIVLSKISIKNIDGTEYWNNGKEHNYNYLERDAIKIELKNPELTNIQQIITFQLTYQDKFDKYHTFLVNGKQTGTSISFPKFFVNEI